MLFFSSFYCPFCSPKDESLNYWSDLSFYGLQKAPTAIIGLFKVKMKVKSILTTTNLLNSLRDSLALVPLSKIFRFLILWSASLLAYVIVVHKYWVSIETTVNYDILNIYLCLYLIPSLQVRPLIKVYQDLFQNFSGQFDVLDF